MALLFHIAGLAAGIAQGEIREQQARHAAGLDNIAGGGCNHGGDAVFFQMTCDQTHGLVADGSDRDQKGDIDLLLKAAAQHFRRILIVGLAL